MKKNITRRLMTALLAAAGAAAVPKRTSDASEVTPFCKPMRRAA